MSPFVIIKRQTENDDIREVLFIVNAGRNYISINYQYIITFLAFIIIKNVMEGNVMIKIAICDDVNLYVEKVRKFVDSFNWGEEIEITEYTDGMDMINDIFKNEDQIYDLIITDIEYTKNRGINAVDLFKKILMHYPEMKIIYITKYDQYVNNVANSLPFGYIKKPFNEIEIHKLFDRYKKIGRNKSITAPSFVFRYKGQIIDIPYGRIKYVYSNWKKVFIVCDDGREIKIRAKLEDIWRESFSQIEYYARANKSYIINLCNAENIFSKSVELDDGVVVSLGKGYLEDFRERSKNFLFWDRN